MMLTPAFFLLVILASLLAGDQVIASPRAPVIAVIDTGIDVDHPRLRGQLWQNPGEIGVDSNGADKSHNGIDDDKNGYVDDVHGWNFVENQAQLKDRLGHGTHVAGLIAESAPAARLMVLKYYDPRSEGNANLDHFIAALEYAVAMHADVINFSSGGRISNLREKFAVKAAADQGILLVAAAGNEASNSDRSPFYPADYGLPNILSVAAHGPDLRLLHSSNFGLRSVSLAAPGYKILSSVPGGGVGPMTGTSQAAAIVTGAIARLMSERPDLRRAEDLIRHVQASVRQEKTLQGKVATGGRLDLLRVLNLQDSERSFSGFKIQALGNENL